MKRKPSHFNSPSYNFDNAQALRKDQTSAEKRMWDMVRNRRVKNAKFRRQHPIGDYIVDFYCHDVKLVIELDGNIHNIEKIRKNDLSRQRVLEKLGFKVLRFSNDDVFEVPERIIKQLEEFIEAVV